MTPSQPPPWQGEEPIEILTNIAGQFPPLGRGGLGWGLSQSQIFYLVLKHR